MLNILLIILIFVFFYIVALKIATKNKKLSKVEGVIVALVIFAIIKLLF